MSDSAYKSFNLPPSNNPHLRVADVLIDREDDGDSMKESNMEGGEERVEKKPRWIVGRLLGILRGTRKARVLQQRRETRDLKGVSFSERPSVNCNGESGQYRNDTSFKLGVTWGLMYMIAASKNEFSKMVELRKEMEMLLRRTEEELPRKETVSKPFKPSDTLSCSITDIQDVSSSTSHIFVPSQPVPEKNMFHDHVQECNLSEQDECVEEMHGLEAELQVELERLQLYLDEETAFEDTQEEMAQVTHMDSSTRSDSTSYRDMIDAQEASNDISFGVHPIELERRLHELLEARLQEQITDLEYALECARQKVIEKETEVTWWKDTVQLISQHVPETSRFTFRLDPEAAYKLKVEF